MDATIESSLEKIEEENIDLFKLKIFALLMCRGKSEDKADFLVDVIIGERTDDKSKNDVFNW
jgi:hypothetical protein